MAESRRQLAVRVASVVVILPVVLVLVWLGGWPFVALAAFAAGLSAWELAGLVLGDGPKGQRWLTAILAAAVPVVAGRLLAGATGETLLAVFAVVPLPFFFGAVLRPGDDLEGAVARAGLGIAAVLYVGGMIACAVRLRSHGPSGFWWLILLMAITWLGDSGAYFAGHAFGRHKLAPRISPGKTIEGAAGGLLAAVGGAFAVQAVSAIPLIHSVPGLHLTPVDCVVAGLIGGIVGPVGDLAESMVKRAFDAKDSGAFMPGHGGLLDRIDALLLNASVLFAFVVLFHR